MRWETMIEEDSSARPKTRLIDAYPVCTAIQGDSTNAFPDERTLKSDFFQSPLSLLQIFRSPTVFFDFSSRAICFRSTSNEDNGLIPASCFFT